MTSDQKNQLDSLLADLAKRQATLEHPAIPNTLAQNPDCLINISTWSSPPTVYVETHLKTDEGLEDIATHCDETSYYFAEEKLVYQDEDIIIYLRITATQRLTQDEKDILTRLGKIVSIHPDSYEALVCGG